MQTNPSFTEEPAQLDADDAVERVLLSTPSGQWELAFFPESKNGHYWRIAELLSSEKGTVPHREVVRFLDLEKNAVIPLGSLQASKGSDWNVVVVYEKGQRNYPLLNQDEASKFQKLITGYKTSERYEGVTCGVIFKNRRLSVLLRDEEDGGIGEIQLWEWPRTLRTRNHPQSNLARSMPTVPLASSIASTVQTLSGNSRGTSLQTTGRRELLLSSIPPPPVLVLFMQDRGLYKMMKVDITDLKFRLSKTQIDLFTGPGRTFSLERLSVKRLEHWNLCAMRPAIKSPATEKLKCTYLSLQFQNPELAGNFVNSLLRLQLSQKKLEGERACVQGTLYNGTLPTSLQAKSPTSSGIETSSSSGFVSLPGIPCTEPLDHLLWRVKSEPQQVAASRQDSITEQQIPELETERRVQEIDGDELDNRFELPNQTD